MTRMAVILKARERRTLARMDGAAAELRRAASDCGVRIMFFGSYARRAVHDRSDLDVLVLKGAPAEATDNFRERAEMVGSRHDVFVDLRKEERLPHLREWCVS
ncbi:MAG: nucleotidyltransferase domain-containing protein [Boseongicola sp.]|nr:nucleotidyltransferase domain-containing protein [Boseongicola sp.]